MTMVRTVDLGLGPGAAAPSRSTSRLQPRRTPVSVCTSPAPCGRWPCASPARCRPGAADRVHAGDPRWRSAPVRRHPAPAPAGPTYVQETLF